MADTGGAPRDLIGFLDYYFVTKAPFQIPAAGREWIARFGPWIVVVLLVLSLPAILLLLGIGALWTPVSLGGYRWGDPETYRWGYVYGYWPLMAGLIVQFALMTLALPGLFARKMSGWRLVFYARLVSLVAGVLAMNVVGALIGALVAFYLLFQIRPLYK